ncbi:MAG TPA: Lrp/AsnC family transcriptional regulator [Bryobacteraceae bacterium]|nr:Lrp/AsnC family transcriptional regulator [Bryobacteraceae bacterium]
MTLDPIDAALLNLLQEDSSRSLLDLGKHVGLSVSGVKERLRKLRARGDVRAYVALINPRSVGYTTCAFVQVVVEGAKNERGFSASILKMPEIEECHRVSGEFAFLIKIWAHDIQHLDGLLNEKIKSRAGVVRTQMSIVLSSPKDQVTGLTTRV